MITWLPVLTDCHGNPDVIVGYGVLLMAIWVAGWYECPGDDGTVGLCPIYAYSPWMDTGIFVPAGAPLYTFDSRSLPDPPVGGLDYYRVVSVDHAGNDSDQECAP